MTDLDIQKFFDTVPHDLVEKAVAHHISPEQRWILLYVRRWLRAPLAQPDGTLVARDCGNPQGSAISPLLPNLFMHYAFDLWMSREFPHVGFERNCDDAVVHRGSEQQAPGRGTRSLPAWSRSACSCIRTRRASSTAGDAYRRDDQEVTSFVFLGYEFRPQLAKSRTGHHFVSFLPAVSADAKKAMSAEIRSWHLARRSDKSLDNLARMFNNIVQGWIIYYARFYRSELLDFLRRLNKHLVRWATRKYKRLKRRERRAMAWLAEIAHRSPRLFAHWRRGAGPDGWAMGAG